MSARYQVFYGDDAKIRDLISSPYERERFHLFRCDDAGTPVEWIACDGGEPEDQTLGRDWSWVADRMNELDAKYRAALSEAIAAMEKLRPAVAQYDLSELGHADSGWMCQSCGESSYDRELVVHSGDCESRIIDLAVTAARAVLESK